jgi:anaerobic magnesium-protoporphyrin IX monomethyl ester cyclase
MKITIVVPQYKPRGQFYELPLGLAYICSSLKNKGHKVEMVNLNTEELVYDPDTEAVLTGGLSVHYGQIKSILQEVRKQTPKAKIIMGGGLISSEPELMHKDLGADLSVIGEGEYLVPTTQGIVEMPAIEDLDELPYPDYGALKVQDYLDRQLCGDEYYLYPFDKPRALPIISSRSCPFNCSFCFHPLGKKYRQRSLDNFFGEVKYLIETYQINILCVLDELLSSHPERLALFCERIKKYNLKWMTQIRVDSIDENTVKMMKASGCYSVSIGVEHVSQVVLESYQKHTTVQQIDKALQLLYDNQINIQGNILLGDKSETDKTFNEVLFWWRKNKKYLINLTPVIPYPGTQLYKYGVQEGYIDPLTFIKSGCPYIEFSNVGFFSVRQQMPAEDSYSNGIGDDSDRGELLEVHGACPHCHHITKYRNIFKGGTGMSFTGGSGYRIACRNCNQRFDIDI